MEFEIGDIVIMRKNGGYGMVGEIGIVTGFGYQGHIQLSMGGIQVAVFPLYLSKIVEKIA